MNARSSNEQLERVKAGKRRRLKLFSIGMALIMLWIASVWMQQEENLKVQREEYALVQEKVKKAKERQFELSYEIKRLHDREYIAEVARKDYFLSRPGEMIFKVPDPQD